MAAGEVLLIGPQLDDGSANGHASVANLTDANSITSWNTFPVTGGWAGVDAGVPCTLTRVHLSSDGGNEDYAVGGNLQGSTTPGFTIPFKQGVAAHINGTGNASISAVYGAQTAGNTNVVFVGTTATAVISGVSDTANGAYTLLVSATLIKVYIKQNIAQANAGSNTVTVSFSVACDFPDLQITEYQGIDPGPLDGSSYQTNAGSTNVSSGNITTSFPSDVIIGYMTGGGTPTHTAGSGFTLRIDEAPWDAALEDDGVIVTGTYAATFTLSVSNNWNCMAVALKSSILSPVRFLTITSRPLTGTLLNEYLVAGGSSLYRYFRFIASSANYGVLGDLDFIAAWTPGLIAACVAPTISPTVRTSDLPLVVSLSCITTDAVMYYTLDGSIPTTASKPYTGPFVISSSCTFKAIATSSGLANSRVTTAVFNIPAAIIPSNFMYDNRNYRIWAVDPCYLKDPISGWWYMYGVNLDQSGVFVKGWMGINTYKSADLVNWVFVNNVMAPPTQEGSSNTNGRPFVMYNAANTNYVCWSEGQYQNSGQHYQVFKSSSPEGPWTLFAQYNTFNSNATTGDMCVFLDSDNVSAYMAYTGPGALTCFIKLNAAWDNWDGVTFVSMDTPSTFGIGAPDQNLKLDGPHMFKNGSTYFFLCNAQNGWAPTVNPYATATAPTGPWTNKGNPFIQVPGPGNGNPDYTLAYDSQNNYIIPIPGRGLFVYTGDRYDNGLPANINTSTTANFEISTVIWLPIVFPTGSTMSITWANSWNLNTYATVSGAPASPSGFSLSSSGFSWTNNETLPHTLYLDFATDNAFTLNTASELIGIATQAGQATSYVKTYRNNPLKGYYRLRVVNANGSSFSPNSIFFSPQSSTVSGGMNEGPLTDTASWIVTTSAGITAGTATFQEVGADGIARNLSDPPPITLLPSQTYQGRISGHFHSLQLSVVGLAGGTITYSEIKTMTNSGRLNLTFQ